MDEKTLLKLKSKYEDLKENYEFTDDDTDLNILRGFEEAIKILEVVL